MEKQKKNRLIFARLIHFLIVFAQIHHLFHSTYVKVKGIQFIVEVTTLFGIMDAFQLHASILNKLLNLYVEARKFTYTPSNTIFRLPAIFTINFGGDHQIFDELLSAIGSWSVALATIEDFFSLVA